jgi:hypothetical protein
MTFPFAKETQWMFYVLAVPRPFPPGAIIDLSAPV